MFWDSERMLALELVERWRAGEVVPLWFGEVWSFQEPPAREIQGSASEEAARAPEPVGARNASSWVTDGQL